MLESVRYRHDTEDESRAPQIVEPSSEEPSLQTLRNAVPKHCFQPSLLVSFAYLGRDIVYASLLVYCALRIQYVPSPWLRAAAWALYGFAQGCVGTGLWIIAHECGHGAFSLYPLVNDIVGWAVDSMLFVPYYSWKITHARHHRFTGHMEKDTAFVPLTENEYAAPEPNIILQTINELSEDTPLVNAIKLILHQLVGWPMYLLLYVRAGKNSYPGQKDGLLRASHFDPFSKLFTPSQRMYVLISDLGLGCTAWGLWYLSSKIGTANVALLWFMPYLWVHHWLVAITYLHHTHPSVPHYSAQTWTFTKGALGTVDRSFGFIGRHFFHEIIDFHVIHHLFPKIPFYRAEEATLAVRPLLGKNYREEKNEPFLSSLVKTFERCSYVRDTASISGKGSGVLYWNEYRK